MPVETKTSKKLVEILEGDYEETLEKIREFREILVNLRYEGRHRLGKNLREAREALGFFTGKLARHIEVEEKVVFPFLQRYLPKLDPLILLLGSEHEEFKKNLRSFQFWLKEAGGGKNHLDHGRLLEKVRETGNYLTYLLQNHLQEESGILYRVAENELRPGEKRELVKRVRQQVR